MKLRTALLPLCLMAALPSLAMAERGLEGRDLATMDRVSSPALSPDGARVVFAKRTVDFEADSASTALYLRDLRTRELPARRGMILDRSGMPLVASFDAYRVKIARNEVTNVDELRKEIAASLKISSAVVTREFERPYPYFHGPYDAAQIQSLVHLDGVHLERVPAREHAMGQLAAPLLGSLDQATATGLGGVEATFDSLLAGIPGKARRVLDGAGRLVPYSGVMLEEPQPGHDLVLTIDYQLQGIVEAELRRAIELYDAHGGDVVVLDVETGEVLALASQRTAPGASRPMANMAAIYEPNEPGSTVKIFTAAAMLIAGADTTPVSGEGGIWRHVAGRIIRDVHRVDGLLTLGEAIQHSSNIAISKFALRLPAEEHFKVLRSFGFGTPQGTGMPGEASGRLMPPASSANLELTQPSWAQGYEFSASAMQVASAYAALANGGRLLAPTLVREVRRWPSGEVIWEHRPQVIREPLDSSTAAHLLEYLRMASDSGGTGGRAQLDHYRVVGKTGTAKLLVDGRYTTEYRASYAGIFPDDEPQVVIYVMIDRPRGGDYYGGLVAAPMVRTMLQQALSLPRPLLRRSGRTSELPVVDMPPVEHTPPAMVTAVSLPLAPDTASTAVGTVPDVTGNDVRDAAFRLHTSGYQVRVVGDGRIIRTIPAAGDSLPRGATVTIQAEGRR